MMAVAWLPPPVARVLLSDNTMLGCFNAFEKTNLAGITANTSGEVCHSNSIFCLRAAKSVDIAYVRFRSSPPSEL